MDAVSHQIPRCRINHAMAGDGVFAGEGLGDNLQIVMTALFGTSMTGVTMRLIFNDQRQRLQAGQSFAQQFDRFGTHAGRTFLNGLTVTFS